MSDKWHTVLLPVLTTNKCHQRQQEIIKWAEEHKLNDSIAVAWTYIGFKNPADATFLAIAMPGVFE